MEWMLGMLLGFVLATIGAILGVWVYRKGETSSPLSIQAFKGAGVYVPPDARPSQPETLPGVGYLEERVHDNQS
jgi:hypothetical protein